MHTLVLSLPLIVAAFTLLFWVVNLRVVASTNEVHIVQSAKRTVSYGKDQAAGNTYYRWPATLPVIGVRVIRLPVSVFPIKLNDYAAYDKGRVPFEIDIIAFFRITDSNMAAQRMSSITDATAQLTGILQGVCRTILANSDIEEILEGRSKFGLMFTTEVDENLKQWGIQSVKQIELMDIRDQEGSSVIKNIMAKKKSLIERESRVAVAANMQAAQVAELEAQQTVAVRQQEVQEQVLVRTATKDQVAGIAAQRANQAVQEEAKITAQKTQAVNEVNTVRQAEITRAAQVVSADQSRQVMVIAAEADAKRLATVAQGTLDASLLNAKGVQATGEAEGAAKTAVLMAPVNAQLKLAAEIGSNAAYQTYLVSIRTVEKDQAVGVAQADAIKAADIKVIANAGNVTAGVTSAMELLSAKGGTAIGAALEAFAQTPTGASLLKKLNGEPAHG